jgi:tetratricopeptide (TPR) repeat protein
VDWLLTNLFRLKLWIRTLALVLPVVFSFTTLDAIAALNPDEQLNNNRQQFMPRSPLVERLQVLFAELKIYSGVIDGRLNDDLTAAVQHYQSRAGLTVDGKVSEELLAHVEFKSEAEALLVRLDVVGSEQRVKAREKLQSVALTRSLLDPARKNQVADLTRNRDICFQAPTVDCLVFEAIESAKAVGRPHFRDWTYGEIAVVQARLGQVEAARETAGRIQDPRLILVTLRNIAVALAKADKIQLALDSAAIIPDEWLKAEALVAIAVAQTRNGGWPQARQTMREIEQLINLPETTGDIDFKKTALTTGMARKLVKAGDPSAAVRIMKGERDRIKALMIVDPSTKKRSGVSASLSTLAAGFAQIDEAEEARKLLDFAVDIVHRRSVSVALARAYGRAGQDEPATAIINALEEPRYRSILLADMARYQALSGIDDRARINLARAETAVAAIAQGQKFAINHARERIATSWIALGDLGQAGEAALRITDAGIRTGVWWQIAVAHIDAGATQLAQKSTNNAIASIASVKSTLDRVWLYCGRVQIMAERRNNQQALLAFSKAMEIARGIRHSWTRAQALVRLVEAFSALPGPLAGSKSNSLKN